MSDEPTRQHAGHCRLFVDEYLGCNCGYDDSRLETALAWLDRGIPVARLVCAFSFGVVVGAILIAVDVLP